MTINNIEKLLGNYFCNQYKIDTSKEYQIEWINAKQLLTYDRIDLIPKILYLNAVETNKDIKIYERLYFESIGAFSCYTYTESGQERKKNSKEKYRNIFLKLYDSIKQNGFDNEKTVIPIGKENAIFDGAHRTAICAFLNLEVPVVKVLESSPKITFDFFRERLMKESDLFEIAKYYGKIKALNWYVMTEKPVFYIYYYKIKKQAKLKWKYLVLTSSDCDAQKITEDELLLVRVKDKKFLFFKRALLKIKYVLMNYLHKLH